MKIRHLLIISVLGITLFTAKEHISSRVDATTGEDSFDKAIKEEMLINNEKSLKDDEELLKDKNQSNNKTDVKVEDKASFGRDNNASDSINKDSGGVTPADTTSLNSPLVLVNKHISLPSNYKPEDLVVPNVSFSFSGPHEKQNMRSKAAKALEELFNAADKEGMTLYAVSGFRSYSRQESVYNGHVQSLGAEEADKISAKPGHSEHQTGLAMDITSRSAGMTLSESFGDTPEGIWVAENAHKFGFIIRYQKGKEDLTGYSYEPWHLRYVGIDAATEIMEADITLENYLEKKSM